MKFYGLIRAGLCAEAPKQILRVMKLTMIIMTFSLLQLSARGIAQNVSLTEKNVPLLQIFSQLGNQTGYHFLYSDEMLKMGKPVSINAKNSPLIEVLNQVFEHQELTYSLKNKTVIVAKREKSIADKVSDAIKILLKNITVSGKVMDEKGKILYGASVKVKNTNKSAKTNVLGEFELQNVDEQAFLLVSYMGYNPREVAVEGKNTVNIVLTEHTASLDTLVVVGYGTTKRKDLVGSVATVKGDEMRKQVATNFTQALVGQTAGVQVSRPTGNPGAGATIRIRGLSTVMGVNDPLYVIDGIPVQLYNGGGADEQRMAPINGLMDPLAGIDMNDIESVEILKDATATAIYGSRAANGVIIVTTKRGRAGDKPVFSFNYDVSIDKQNKFYDVLSGPEFVKFMQETYAKQGQTIDDATFPGTGNTDWQRAVARTGLVQNMNIGLLGAAKDGGTVYGFSAGLTDQQGILLNTGFKRYSIRANVESKVSGILKVGANLNFSASRQEGGAAATNANQGVAGYRPDIPIFNADGNYANDGNSDNPVAAKQITDLNDSKRLLATVYAELEIIPGLKARSSLAYDINDNAGYSYTPSWLLLESAIDEKGARSDRSFKYTNRIFDNTITYTKAFDRHHIDAVGGASWTLNRSNYHTVNSINFPNDDVLNNLGSAGAVAGYSSGAESSGLASYFIRANYNYNAKYYLTVSGRADNSTKFGPNNQWGYFPSVGLAWRFSSEKFMERFHFIDDAKLRFTVGKTGTSAFGNFGFLTLFNSGYFYNGVNGLRANPDNGEPNPDIHWESTTQTDAALEISFLKSRLRTSVNYYKKYTRGLITGPAVPVSNGYNFQTKNVGDVSNQGWEFTLSGTPIDGTQFTWLSELNITFNKNKVEKAYGTSLYGLIPLIEGQPLNGIEGHRTNGLFQNQAEIDQLNALARQKTGNPNAFYQNAKTAPGDLYYRDLNRDGIITDADRVILGYSQNPKYFGGWKNTFRYQNLELSSLFQFDVGSKLQRQRNTDIFTGYTANVSPTVLKGWTPENTNTNQPKNSVDAPAQNTSTVTDRFTDDASFLRLKSVQLSYLFNSAVLKKFQVQQIRVFTGMTNLFTWTKYKGLDPESNNENSFTEHGKDSANYPQARSMTFGVNVKF